MTRENLLEAMARAAWEGDAESAELPCWQALTQEARDEWIGFQRHALTAMQRLIPGVAELLDRALV